MLILPAIDLRGGKCVRLYQGDYEQETCYSDDPVEVAKRFEAEGAEWLHVVDLDGARSGSSRHLDVLHTLRANTRLHIEFGGGIRTHEQALSAIASGASRIVLGSVLVKDPTEAAKILNTLGEQAVAMVDARGGKVATEGWQQSGGCSVVETVKRACQAGARRIAITDIERDGTLAGPNLELLEQVLEACEVPVIASGGVSCLEDVAALSSVPYSNLEGVIIGKALYEGRFTLHEALLKSG